MKRISILLNVLMIVVGLSVSAQAALQDMHDGTIYDTDTQLSWLQNADTAGAMPWANANTWAASLNAGSGFAGLTGWRLPTTTQPDATCNGHFDPGGGLPIQGYSLNCINSEMGHLYYTELGNAAGGPLTNRGPFTNVQVYNYWSDTDYVPNTTNAWTFHFNLGDQYNHNKDYGYYAWAVRPGARAIGNLVDMHDGTIYDTDTQLSWLQNANTAGFMTWADANTWAASLNAGSGFAGLTGWRLPTSDTCGGYNCTNSEMGHLYYTELGNAAGGPLTNSGPFTDVQAFTYWSDTEYAPNPDYAWAFSFYDGFQNDYEKGQVFYAWAVRPGARAVTPSQQLANILSFFDSSASVGTLVGSGPGNSAKGRMKALENMIEEAGQLIVARDTANTCQQLIDAYKRTDGLSRPPDFVAGEAASELAAMIQDLRASLGCH